MPSEHDYLAVVVIEDHQECANEIRVSARDRMVNRLFGGAFRRMAGCIYQSGLVKASG
jgi:hypothetical protein